jgi:hypothetical protein
LQRGFKVARDIKNLDNFILKNKNLKIDPSSILEEKKIKESISSLHVNYLGKA